MKRLLLPISLISFAVICLSIVHIDNINRLESQSNRLRQKHKKELGAESQRVQPILKNREETK